MTEWKKDQTGVDVSAHKTRHQNGGGDEIDLTGLAGTEIRLTPKASSTSTAEGTIFYDSDDNHIWVATE